jgi:hypothetical protein
VFLNKRLEGKAPVQLFRKAANALNGVIPDLSFEEYLAAKEKFPVQAVELLSGREAFRGLDRQLMPPKSVQLADEKNAPDFKKEMDSYRYENDISGPIQARSYRSQNGKFAYTIHEELKTGRIWIGSITNESAPINEFGVSSSAVSSPELVLPLWEREGAVSEAYRGKNHPGNPRLVSTWPYLWEMGLVKTWYASQGRAVPPLD